MCSLRENIHEVEKNKEHGQNPYSIIPSDA